MVIKGTYHNHTIWSDGAFTPEALVERAIELGFQEVGITDHLFTLKGSIKCVKPEQIEDYLKMIKGLRTKYEDNTRILGGLEIDTTVFNPQRLRLPYDKLNKLDYVLFEYVEDYRMAQAAKRIMIQSYIKKTQSEIMEGLIAEGASKIGAWVQAQLSMKENQAIQEQIKHLTETKAVLTLDTLIAIRKKIRCPVGLAHPKLPELISLHGAETLAKMLADHDIFIDVCGSAKNGRRSLIAKWRKHRPFYLYLEEADNVFQEAALRYKVAFIPSSDTHDDDEDDRMVDTFNAIEIINKYGLLQKIF